VSGSGGVGGWLCGWGGVGGGGSLSNCFTSTAHRSKVIGVHLECWHSRKVLNDPLSELHTALQGTRPRAVLGCPEPLVVRDCKIVQARAVGSVVRVRGDDLESSECSW
jgi:hypothetical protein